MKRRLLCLAAAGAVLTGTAVLTPAAAAPVPAGATWSQVYLPSGDGTMLHADVLLPKDRAKTAKHPVILSIGPYFGSGSQDHPAYRPDNAGPSARFNDLVRDGEIFARGYALVLVDSRGYGSSAGCYDLGGKGEQMDVKAAVEWAAQQPWSNGKVGMWGKSYDAWTQIMALATKPKGLAATVIMSPLLEGYRGFFENGVHWDAGWYATPGLYLGYDLIPPSLRDATPEEFTHSTAGTATHPDCYARNMTESANPDPSTPYWRERDIVARAAASTVPSMWSFGFNDDATKPTNIFDVYGKLRGPKRAWFGQWDHKRGNEEGLIGREGFMGEAMAWFDHYLKGKPLPSLPRHEIQDGDGAWRTEAVYPPADGVLRTMPVKPGSYVDQPGSSAAEPKGGTWTVSQPAPHEVRIAGLPRLTVDATTSLPSGGNLIASVYDVAPNGTSRRVTRGAYKLRGSGKTSFQLWPTDWRLPKGHRIALHLVGDDSTTYQPTYTGSTVTVKSGSLPLPLLTFVRTSNLEGEVASAQGTIAKPTLTAATLAGRDVKADFGPPMRRR